MNSREIIIANIKTKSNPGANRYRISAKEKDEATEGNIINKRSDNTKGTIEEKLPFLILLTLIKRGTVYAIASKNVNGKTHNTLETPNKKHKA